MIDIRKPFYQKNETIYKTTRTQGDNYDAQSYDHTWSLN